MKEDGNVCLDRRYLFTPSEAGYYRVRLIVKNDCYLTDTFTKVVYVPYSPVAFFTAPDSICPGFNVLHANGSLSTSNINKCRHRWTVESYIDESTDTFGLNERNFITKDWFIDTLTSVSSDFTFPGYEFEGGMKYIISLQVWGWCTDSIWTTEVSVPLKVNINIKNATSYLSPLGPRPIQLNGIVLNATSWSWDPTTYLDTPGILTPITTPSTPIVYTLTGTLGACSLTDTVTIQFNTLAYAGPDRTVCGGDQTMLGTKMNTALMVGMFYYLEGSAFWDIYDLYRGDSMYKFLTAYMLVASEHDVTKERWYNNPGIREELLKEPWIMDYFQSFMSTNGDEATLIDFVTEISKSKNDVLIDIFESLPRLPEYQFGELNSIFSDYTSWYNNAVSNNELPDLFWERLEDTVWVELTDWRGFHNILVDTNASTTYRLTYIDHVHSVVEYDEVFVEVDSVITPIFDVFYQEDSTMYFADETLPFSNYTYIWAFGDGDSSTLQNPVHTFAAFDSAYRVCLSVTNSCGTYTSCDTVWVDSLSLATNGFSKRGQEDNGQGPLKETSISGQQLITQLKEGVQLDNIPNPFTDITSITYLIDQPYRTASIRITDVLGRVIQEQSLRSSKGKIPFDGSMYAGGVYYTSLIIDGAVVKNKTMVIQH